MSPHGVAREGVCTVSARIEQSDRDKLDEIKKKRRLKTRSSLIREIIARYLAEVKPKTSKRREKTNV